MGDNYVDPATGSNLNTGSSWAQAWDGITTLENNDSSRDRNFLRTDSGGTADNVTDTVWSIATASLLYSVKNGTTSEGDSIVDSDLTQKGDTDQYHVDSTVVNISSSSSYFHGIYFDLSSRIDVVGSGTSILDNCNVDSNGFGTGGINNSIIFWQCTFTPTGSGSRWDATLGSAISVLSGELDTTNANPTRLFIGPGSFEVIGFDFSSFGNNSFSDFGNSTSDNNTTALRNCSVPATYSATVGTAQGAQSIEIILSTNDTGLSVGESVQQYLREDPYGVCSMELTKVRTGGATDDQSGSWAYKLLPNANAVNETINGVTTPWLTTWVDGNGTTKTVTIYIANDGSGDLNKDEIDAEIYYPSATGSAQYDRSVAHGEINPGTTTAATDDTGSTWGGSVGNHQKMEFSIAPDYDGYVYVRVWYMKREASPNACYVDGRVHVAGVTPNWDRVTPFGYSLTATAADAQRPAPLASIGHLRSAAIMDFQEFNPPTIVTKTPGLDGLVSKFDITGNTSSFDAYIERLDLVNTVSTDGLLALLAFVTTGMDGSVAQTFDVDNDISALLQKFDIVSSTTVFGGLLKKFDADTLTVGFDAVTILDTFAEMFMDAIFQKTNELSPGMDARIDGTPVVANKAVQLGF